MEKESAAPVELDRQSSRKQIAVKLGDLRAVPCPGAEEIGANSLVEHSDHGVGRYLGVRSLQADGRDDKYLELEYAAGDKIYIPLGVEGQLRVYTGPPGDESLAALASDESDSAEEDEASNSEEECLDIPIELWLGASLIEEDLNANYTPEQAYLRLRSSGLNQAASKQLVDYAGNWRSIVWRAVHESEPVDKVNVEKQARLWWGEQVQAAGHDPRWVLASWIQAGIHPLDIGFGTDIFGPAPDYVQAERALQRADRLSTDRSSVSVVNARSRLPGWLRWVLVFPIAVIGYFAIQLIIAALSAFSGSWLSWLPVWAVAFVNSWASGFAFVYAAAWIAPRGRILIAAIAAACVSLFGAIVAGVSVLLASTTPSFKPNDPLGMIVVAAALTIVGAASGCLVIRGSTRPVNRDGDGSG